MTPLELEIPNEGAGMTEEWRRIPSAHDYEASSLGRIRRATPANGTRVGLVIYVRTRKYCDVRLMVCGKNRTYRVHRLVLAAFSGFMPAEQVHVNHIDGDKRNNKIENLEWCTRSENMAHATRLGLNRLPNQDGENGSAAVMTTAIVQSVRRRVSLGESQRAIARELGVSPATICYAVNRKTWRSVA